MKTSTFAAISAKVTKGVMSIWESSSPRGSTIATSKESVGAGTVLDATPY